MEITRLRPSTSLDGLMRLGAWEMDQRGFHSASGSGGGYGDLSDLRDANAYWHDGLGVRLDCPNDLHFTLP